MKLGFSLTPSADCVNANSKVAPFDCNTKANVLTTKLADKSASPLNSPTPADTLEKIASCVVLPNLTVPPNEEKGDSEMQRKLTLLSILDG